MNHGEMMLRTCHAQSNLTTTIVILFTVLIAALVLLYYVKSNSSEHESNKSETARAVEKLNARLVHEEISKDAYLAIRRLLEGRE